MRSSSLARYYHMTITALLCRQGSDRHIESRAILADGATTKIRGLLAGKRYACTAPRNAACAAK
jgi:hypothetical protein